MTTTETRKRGPQGPRQWRDTPTDREIVITEALARYIKSETGRDVSPETVRAVRHCLPRFMKEDETKSLRKNMDAQLERAKLQNQRNELLRKLREKEEALQTLGGSSELNGETPEEDDEDMFAEAGKVKASF